jgi:hypothetical protein
MRAVNGSNAQTLNQNLNITALPLIGSLVLAPTSVTAGESVLMTATMAPAMQMYQSLFMMSLPERQLALDNQFLGYATLTYNTP